ncbi:PREDICTED: uncharacterized protein LOC109224223 [Nicotiana attenuata]|uniref:uncharacterized protein LOC109224223 n=1 Tax=Nicotiana attenuata TaxID=49451 RepID=UPI000904BB48|nr:PREDICTED: uncharacterized protein LOC109224223 [Nicotiana attenuata]
MWRLRSKLKLLSRRLSQWSREDIGDIHEQVLKCEQKIQSLEEHEIISNTEAAREETNKAHAEYIRWLNMQDSLLIQKTNFKGFEEGDRNTRYFYSMIREKRRKLQLNRIKNHKGKWIQGDNKIAKVAIKHFNSIFNLPVAKIDPTLLNCISKRITEEESDNLNKEPSEEEIRHAVFSLSASSAAGPDGYNGTFFHNCWDIIE